MSADIETVVFEKVYISKKFALQLNESTDISGHAQLLANVRFVDGDVIRENSYFARPFQKEHAERKLFESRPNIFAKEGLCGKIAQAFAPMEQQPWSDVIKAL